jgi:heme-degrading monooxygenase HmoA
MDQPRVTVFRSRLRADAEPEYSTWADKIERLARAAPGFVEFTSFTATDGERVSIIVFASEATHNAWRDHPEYRQAQALGRTRFYADFHIHVCDLLESRHFATD